MRKVFKQKSKFIIALLVVFLIMAASVGGTIAYYTASDKAANTFTIATLTTEIYEGENTLGTATTDINNNNAYRKEVSIYNSSNTYCLVRVRVEITPEAQAGNILIDGSSVTIGADGVSWTQYLGTKWVYNVNDGYFYYIEPVASNAFTDLLMHTITISDTSDLENFDIIIYQEAIQTSVHGTDEFYGTLDVFAPYNNEIMAFEIYEDGTFSVHDGYMAVWNAYDICKATY